jgi:hypothetical protein
VEKVGKKLATASSVPAPAPYEIFLNIGQNSSMNDLPGAVSGSIVPV